MAVDYFLEIVTKKGGKIKGETLSQACPEQIDVDSFTIGLSSPTDYTTGEATGRVQLEHAEFEFPTSIATTPLFQTLCTNDVIKTLTLTCRKASGATGKEANYLQWRFHDARLVSYKMVGDEEVTYDSIKVAYTDVEICYKQQKQDGSISQTGLSARYDANENAMSSPTLK